MWGLYDKVPARHRVAVLLGAFAGLRVAEVCGLRVEDVDFMRGIVRPAVQYPAEPLKCASSRAAMPISKTMALELAEHVKTNPAVTLLSTEDGGRRTVDRSGRGCSSGTCAPTGARCQARRPNCGTTDLRHYFASLLIAGGADVEVVHARLRHASATTTLNTCSHLRPDADDRTRAVVEDVFSARAVALADSVRINEARRAYRCRSEPREA